jgi:23S rRNA maturation-related 3'-5' exoribonuclease YhaM
MAPVSKDITDEIKRNFPAIEEIQSQKLKEIVYNAWGRAISECEFDSLDEIPFSVYIPGVSLKSHINWVTSAALSLVSLMEEKMNITANRDLLIAASLLHDLGKAYEYKKDGETYKKTQIGEQFIHGFWGTYISLLEGAPNDLAHLISTHCNDSPVPPQLIEGIILHYADFAHADILRFQQNLEPFFAS